MIKLENVTKVYKGDNVALRDATLGIDKGEFVFLVGASGSGKSTFIRLLNREEVPEHGTIYVAGKDIGTLGRWKVPYLRRNIGYIFQDFKLSAEQDGRRERGVRARGDRQASPCHQEAGAGHP